MAKNEITIWLYFVQKHYCMLYWLRLVDWVLSSRTVIVVISKARTFPPPFIFGDQGDPLVVRPGFGTEATYTGGKKLSHRSDLCIGWERSLVPFSCRIPDILLVATSSRISSRIPDTGSDNRASLDFITCSFNCSSPGSIPLSAQIDPLMWWHLPTVVAPLFCTSSVYRLLPLHFPPILFEDHSFPDQKSYSKHQTKNTKAHNITVLDRPWLKVNYTFKQDMPKYHSNNCFCDRTGR